MTLAEELGSKLAKIKSLTLTIYIYVGKGELDQALEYSQQRLALTEELGHKLAIINAKNALGYIYARKGKLDRALEYWHQTLALSKKISYKQAIATSLNNIGYSYQIKGDLDQALKYCQQSLTLAEEIRDKHSISSVRDTIGFIFWQKGDFDQALMYLDQSLVLYEELGNKQSTSETLFHLISVTIDMASLDRARQYLQRLQQLNEQEDNIWINQFYRVAEALVLKTSSRARHRGKAEELLEQVAQEEVVSQELTIMASLHLCDLLLAELRTSDDPELLEEVKDHVSRLREIANQQGSHWVLTETYVLESKLALVELDVQRARWCLGKAQTLAEKRGLQRLAMQISTEYDTLLDQLSQWEDLITRNVPLAERAELAHLEEQVVRMIRKRAAKTPELIEEEPELLLIVGADSGLNVFSKTFRKNQLLMEHLIAGYLSAINAFVRDAFTATDSIERIKHAEYTLLLQSMGPFIICYVIKGPSYFALQKLGQLTEDLQASPTVWQGLTEALQTRRLVTNVREVEELVTKIFHD